MLINDVKILFHNDCRSLQIILFNEVKPVTVRMVCAICENSIFAHNDSKLNWSHYNYGYPLDCVRHEV